MAEPSESRPSEGGAPSSATRLLDTPVATAINATVCIIGTLSLASSIVFVVLTFSDDSPLGSAEFGPSFGLTFLLWGWMFALFFHHGLLLRPRLCGRRRHPLRRAPNWGAIKTLVPKASYLIVPVLVALAGTAAASAADGGLSGQPEFDAATRRYVLDDHGSLLPDSHAGYIHAVALQNRLFLSVPIIFTSLALTVAWGEWFHRRSQPSPLWSRPVKARPLWFPPIGATMAVLAVGLALLGLFGSVIVSRVTTYQNTAIRLHRNGRAVVTLTTGDYVVFVGCTESLVCPSFGPDDVVVHRGRRLIPVIRDPSRDHLTFGQEPYVGLASFDVPESGLYLIQTRAHVSSRLVVLHSPGQEAFSLIGWIAGAVIGALLAFYGVISAIAWYYWRFAIGEGGAAYRPRFPGGSAWSPPGPVPR